MWDVGRWLLALFAVFYILTSVIVWYTIITICFYTFVTSPHKIVITICCQLQNCNFLIQNRNYDLFLQNCKFLIQNRNYDLLLWNCNFLMQNRNYDLFLQNCNFLIRNRNYDFNAQKWFYMSKITILPELILKCK